MSSPPTIQQRQAARMRPDGSVVMRQTWTNLLFLHWSFPAADVQRTLPEGLSVDTFAGAAWVGVVPFFMRRVRPRGLPAVGRLSNFLELNVRTYVHDANGRPGVWFYSLDCNQPVAVTLARRFFHLPYEHAKMRASVRGDQVTDYFAQRRGDPEPAEYEYRSASSPVVTAEDSLEFFLVERYELFAHDYRGNRLFSGRVHHAPYRVSAASVPRWSALPLRQSGFNPGTRAPEHQCMAEAVDVEVFGLRECR